MDCIRGVRDKGLGKVIGQSIWVHLSAVPAISLADLGPFEAHGASVTRDEIVLRLDDSRKTLRVAALHYPSFMIVAHPALCCSTLFNVTTGTRRYRSFDGSANKPILHRKELMVDPSHPRFKEFRQLTEEEVGRGLLDHTKAIGWSLKWELLLADRGLTIRGHTLLEAIHED